MIYIKNKFICCLTYRNNEKYQYNIPFKSGQVKGNYV